MFDKFGEFDSYEELNAAAAKQLAQKDTESLKALASENGIDEEDVEDYLNADIPELTTPLTAALGKLKIEKQELGLKGILEDWYEAVTDLCINSEAVRAAVRKKGKRLDACMGRILSRAFEGKVQVSSRILDNTAVQHNGKTEKIRGPLYIGIPCRAEVKKIIEEYYLS